MRRLALLAAVALAATACADGSGTDRSGPTAVAAPEVAVPVIATFEVAGGERFKALLTHADDIAVAQRLLAGEDAPGIPNGRLVRETGVNVDWSWSLDPNDIEFADATIEACDGLPSDVESGTLTGDRYCPWSAVVVAMDPAP
jgi:hypothetical protein